LTVSRIRIAVLDLPPKLREIIEDAVAEERDMELVTTELQTAADLMRLNIDVAIVGTRDPDDTAQATNLLFTAPRVRVLMIATSGRMAALYELHPRRLRLGEASAPELMRAIRAGVPAHEEQQ
jgi:hypothetical protein